MQKFFPSAPPYEIVHRNLYVTHQRVAAHLPQGPRAAGRRRRARQQSDRRHGAQRRPSGRAPTVRKAGRSPGGATDRLLDLYDRQRRTVAVEFVQEQSIANKKRLEARDPEVRAKAISTNSAHIAADPASARANFCCAPP